jgi:hypothetical protein
VSSGFATQGAFDRGLTVPSPDPTLVGLRRDGHWSQIPHTFRADLPDGTYQVTVTLGDASFARDKMQIKANGVVVTPAGGVSTAAGQFAVVSFAVAVSGASPALELEFRDLGGDPYWAVNGFSVRSTASVGTLTVTGPGGTANADGLTPLAFSVTVPNGLLVTLATDLGTLSGASDASSAYPGLQVLGTGAAIPFTLLSPSIAGVATVTATAVDGAARGEFQQTFALAPVRRFDFNGPSNDTASGFVGVRGATTYSPSRGYGWNAATSEFERPGPTALRRDGHYGAGSSGNTFTIQVQPGTSYSVRVYVGDAWFTRDRIEVAVEGASAYTIASLAAGAYDTRTVTGSSADSTLTITIRDLGGDPYWVVNGIDIWTPAAADPGVQTLQAAVVGQALPGAKLSTAQLSAVVEQAIGIWSATGLTEEQVALLRSTPVLVGDLNAQGYLAMTTPDRIVIDDDGAGLGWYRGVGLGRGSGDRGIGQRYDLLTVVLHEMGHVLGRDHDAADDLMNAILQPGVRHLPDLDAAFAAW